MEINCESNEFSEKKFQKIIRISLKLINQKLHIF